MLSVSMSHINFWMPEWILRNLVIPLGLMSVAYFISTSHQSLCMFISPFPARQLLSKNIAAPMKTCNNTKWNNCWVRILCDIQLWGTASTSNIEILTRFQSKALCMIVDAAWYLPNKAIWRDLQTPTVKDEIRRYSFQYSARLSAYPNDLIVNLMELPDNSRLRRHLSKDLPTRFLV
jgi:hypothetical protein